MISRGDVFWVDLDPARGAEQGKVRPAVVVSSSSSARTAERLGQGLVTVVPLTSNVSRVLAFQVLVRATSGGVRVDSKAQTEQMRSVDISRFHQLIGVLPLSVLRELDDALRLHLSL